MVITSITKSTAGPFERLLPAAELERVLDGRAYGLGAVDEEEADTPRAAGVLVFTVEQGSDGEKDCIAAILRWFYVPEELRRRGAGEALLRDLFRIADGSGIEHILCDVPMPAEYDELYLWLESWGFDFTPMDIPQVETTLAALLENPAIAKAEPGGTIPLREIGDSALASFFSRLHQLPDTPTDIDERFSFYDPDISCVTLSKNAIDGALLIHVDAQGAMELSLLQTLSHSPREAGYMVAAAAKAAAKKLPPDTPLRYLCRTQAACDITMKLFPGLEPLLVRRGYLYNGPEPAEEEVSP